MALPFKLQGIDPEVRKTLRIIGIERGALLRDIVDEALRDFIRKHRQTTTSKTKAK